jgi:23S rRNA (guanine745-N1)-methyltransferase
MFKLRCTVRNCDELLERRDVGLFCSSGHHFDQSKGGYWNLTQPQDKKSLDPGDNDDAVMARHRWLERGHAEGLVEAIRPWLESGRKSSLFENVRSNQRALDLGCGEGTFGPALFGDSPQDYCGIDLSRRAMKLAARRWPEATWVLANADRILPVTDKSIGRVVSLFGRRPIGEIARVLTDDGVCVVAVPGEEDLIELRVRVQNEGHRRSRWEQVVEEMRAAELTLVEHRLWTHRVDLDVEEIGDALAMTYRAVRKSQQDRLAALGRTKVTLAADLMLFKRNP